MKALQIELGESLINEQERTMLNRYHKIRFFGMKRYFLQHKTVVLIVLLEKKKAHRKLKKIVNKLEETPDDEELKKKKEIASLNVQYIDVSGSILWISNTKTHLLLDRITLHPYLMSHFILPKTTKPTMLHSKSNEKI